MEDPLLPTRPPPSGVDYCTIVGSPEPYSLSSIGRSLVVGIVVRLCCCVYVFVLYVVIVCQC